jgi:hypothetical protein
MNILVQKIESLNIQPGAAYAATKCYNHRKHRKGLTTKHTNHTKKIIVNFLLRKNLTIDFMKNVVFSVSL